MQLSTVYPPIPTIYYDFGIIRNGGVILSTKKLIKAVLIVLSALVTVTQAADEMELFTDDEVDYPP